MLEVHPPHKVIASLKEFLVHIVTIIVGLLIAVGIERFVEWRHHEHLVSEARETLRREIAENAKATDEALLKIEAEQKTQRANVRIVTASLKSHDDSDQAELLRMNLSKAKLRDTGWKTAQLTGALAYMSYAEAQTFNDIYDKQSAYLARQEAVLEDIAQWIGLATRITHSNSSRLTPDQASALYDWLGTWEGHLALLHVAAKVAADRQHAYLEQRAPLENIHESIQTDSEAAEEPKK